MPTDIYALKTRESVLDFQDLLKSRREKGFQHFIPDLAKEPECTGTGWKFKGGLLTVDTTHSTDQIMAFLESKLEHHKWFETRATLRAKQAAGVIIETPQLPPGFEAYTQVFKSLGYWGKNPAMDVATIIENEDGSLSLQVIIRQHDKKYAFVGGMVDKDFHLQKAEIIKKCQQEFLEEFYSNDLFAAGSATLREGAKKSPAEMQAAIEAVFADKEFAKLAAIKDRLIAAFMQSGLFNSKIAALNSQLKTLGAQNGIRTEDLDVFWVRIKCRLYEKLFPTQYQDLCSFLEANMVQMPETTNESDPRNTQLAFMTTTPHYFTISKAVLKAREKGWLVEAKGGDDALSAKVVKLEDLFDKPMFSAHGRILLDMLADIQDKIPTYFDHPLRAAQLEAIRAKITRREEVELGITHAVSGVVLQQAATGGAPHLPVVSGSATLTQLNEVRAAAGQDVSMGLALSAQEANRILQDRIGLLRYARMEDILERYLLPASARVVLAELAQHGVANILLDNSGSMNGEYIPSQGAPTTRWGEAHDRLNKILPLLALAGIRVEFRLLNAPRGSFAVTKTFDFSKAAIGDDVTTLERALLDALNYLDRNVFSMEPDGTTYVKDHLAAFFTRTPASSKHLTLFITDGEANDKDEAISLLTSRKIANNPLMVVACTNSSQEISWVRGLAKEPASGIAMLDDFGAERKKIEKYHGPLVPYSDKIWLLLHITAPALPTEECVGFHVYHRYASGNPFSKEEVMELLGYEIDPVDYQEYLTTRAQFLSNPVQTAVAVPVTAAQPMLSAYGLTATGQGTIGGLTATGHGSTYPVASVAPAPSAAPAPAASGSSPWATLGLR